MKEALFVLAAVGIIVMATYETIEFFHLFGY